VPRVCPTNELGCGTVRSTIASHRITSHRSLCVALSLGCDARERRSRTRATPSREQRTVDLKRSSDVRAQQLKPQRRIGWQYGRGSVDRERNACAYDQRWHLLSGDCRTTGRVSPLALLLIALVAQAADAAVTFRAASQSPLCFGDINCPVSVASPAAAPGDFVIAQVGWESQPGYVLTPDPGFVLLRTDEIVSDSRSSLYYRIATATEPSSSTWSVNHGTLEVVVASWSGVDTTNPIDGSGAFVDPNSCATSEVASLTTARDSTRLLFMLNADGATDALFPSGMALRWDTVTLFGADQGLGTAGTYSRTATIAPAGGDMCPLRAIAQVIGLASRTASSVTTTTTPIASGTSTSTTIPGKHCRKVCRTLRKACRAKCIGAGQARRLCKRECADTIRTSRCRGTGQCVAP